MRCNPCFKGPLSNYSSSTIRLLKHGHYQACADVIPYRDDTKHGEHQSKSTIPGHQERTRSEWFPNREDEETRALSPVRDGIAQHTPMLPTLVQPPRSGAIFGGITFSDGEESESTGTTRGYDTQLHDEIVLGDKMRWGGQTGTDEKTDADNGTDAGEEVDCSSEQSVTVDCKNRGDISSNL